MPKIVINEIDNTSPGPNAQSDEVVLVTGFLGRNATNEPVPTGEAGECYMLTTIDELESIIGKYPYVFEQDILQEAGSEEILIAAGSLDNSYIMTREYIQQGLAVQYYVLSEVNSNTELETLYNIGAHVHSMAKIDTSAYVNSTFSFARVQWKVDFEALSVSGVEPIGQVIENDRYKLNQSGTISDRTYSSWELTKEELTSRELRLNKDLFDKVILKYSSERVANPYLVGFCIKVADANGVYTEDTDDSGSYGWRTISDMQVYDTEDPNKYADLFKHIDSAATQLHSQLHPNSDSDYTKVRVGIRVATASGPANALTSVNMLQIVGVPYTDLQGTLQGQLNTGTDDAVMVEFETQDNKGNTVKNYALTDYGNGIATLISNSTYLLCDDYKRVIKEDATYVDTIISDICSAVSTSSDLTDRGNYSMKYVTAGAYPVFLKLTQEDDVKAYTGVYAQQLISFAAYRGDCVAIIDHPDYLDISYDPNNNASIYRAFNPAIGIGVTLTDGEYGAMFTGWGTYSVTTGVKNPSTGEDVTTFRAPASYAYLMALAHSNKTNAPWLAIAGATRGQVRYTDGTMQLYTNKAADAMQERKGVRINALTNIRPYGITIWGNATLKEVEKNLVATNFLNIRNLVSDIKKLCYSAAKALTFEQNNDVLWVNFQSMLNPTLDRMLSGYGISGYKIVKNPAHPKAKEKATLCAKIILYPIYAVEDFYIDIVLSDAEVTFE